jgi:hypothetical protein
MRHVQEGRHLLGTPSRDDADQPVTPGERGEDLAGAVDGTSQLGTRDDLRE